MGPQPLHSAGFRVLNSVATGQRNALRAAALQLLVVVLVGWLVLVHRRQRQNATQQLSAVEQQRLQALLQRSAAPSADAGQSRVGQSDVGGAHDA